jgi:hypothetical protein
MFDIFLACAPKDYNKLPFVITAITKNVSDYDDIYICSPTEIPVSILKKIPVKYKVFFDDKVLPVDRKGWRHRSNWCFQQHLKLFQGVTQDWYLTLDCDTIINRPLKFFENNKPNYWKGHDQFNPPYFIWQALMIGLPKVDKHTFVADMNLIHRPIINEMLKTNDYTIDSFIAKSQKITNEFCYIGEPELYGSYCYKNYPDLYTERFLKQKAFGGRVQKNVKQILFDNGEIEALIERAKELDIDTFSIHSWLVENEPSN